ncbi:MAG TPA: 3'(2'),5'-bisphosphate nucleotidase CysQ, partial [Pseudomonas sp.]|nr:3'(2'),5'-bisphosphate nucleotidase CysQ [Pseudomonas sp.]
MSHPYLAPVIDLVQAAGHAILPHWRSELQVHEKADASPVTAADLAAHHLLSEGLQALDASIPVLSEEACDLALAERA